mmetsp:Transcript_25816/g.65078  ORF Transcript_25816/g.65078 Transcript_25816/m.65078 type:complete len:212 (-) Transcript_25816:7-642(-)
MRCWTMLTGGCALTSHSSNHSLVRTRPCQSSSGSGSAVRSLVVCPSSYCLSSRARATSTVPCMTWWSWLGRVHGCSSGSLPVTRAPSFAGWRSFPPSCQMSSSEYLWLPDDALHRWVSLMLQSSRVSWLDSASLDLALDLAAEPACVHPLTKVRRASALASPQGGCARTRGPVLTAARAPGSGGHGASSSHGARPRRGLAQGRAAPRPGRA